MRIAIKYSVGVLMLLAISWVGIFMGSLFIGIGGIIAGVLVSIGLPFILMFATSLLVMPIKLRDIKRVNVEETDVLTGYTLIEEPIVEVEETNTEVEEFDLEVEEPIVEVEEDALEEVSLLEKLLVFIENIVTASLVASVIGAGVVFSGIKVLSVLGHINETLIVLGVCLAYLVPYVLILNRLTGNKGKEVTEDNEVSIHKGKYIYYGTILTSVLGVVLLTSFYSSTMVLGWVMIVIGYALQSKLISLYTKPEDKHKGNLLTKEDNVGYTTEGITEVPEVVNNI